MRLVAVVVLLLAVAVAVGLRVLGKQEARLVIENHAGATIQDLTVEVSGQRFALGSLPANKTATVRISDYTDSDWLISGRWPDGSETREHLGYITHGMSCNDRAVFNADRKIEYTSRSR